MILIASYKLHTAGDGENLEVSKLDNDHLKICFSGNYIQNILRKLTRGTDQKSGGFKLQ